MTFTRIALIASLFALTASTAFAGIVRVGPNRTYTTIQDGVDNASEGDTILIDKGVYVEEVDVATRSLTIRPAKKGKKGKVTISGQISFFDTDANDCTVRDLTVVDSVFSGIAVELTAGVRIIRCTVSGGASLAGIAIGLSNSTLVHKCKVLNVSGVGIRVEASFQTVISECKVKEASVRGIELLDSTADATIIKNKIIDSGMNVRAEDVSGCLVSRNTLVGGNSVSLNVTGTSSQCVIEKNILRNSTLDGMLLEPTCAELLITKNKIDNCGHGVGIYFSGADSTLLSNKVTDTSQDGIFMDSSSSTSSAIKNKVKRSGNNGLLIGGDHLMLIQNVARKSSLAEPGTYYDLQAATATNCLYIGNVYDTTDL